MTMRIADLEIDPIRHRVTRAGQRIDLTAKDAASPDAKVWADATMLIRASATWSPTRCGSPLPAPAWISLDASSDGVCRIAVTNDGPSIAPTSQPRVFERFYRGDEAREHSSSSSGLDLAIVRSIMDLHGGVLAVESEPGRKTTFRLTFPSQLRGASSAPSSRSA